MKINHNYNIMRNTKIILTLPMSKATIMMKIIIIHKMIIFKAHKCHNRKIMKVLIKAFIKINSPLFNNNKVL